jgi:hypothetical protein
VAKFSNDEKEMALAYGHHTLFFSFLNFKAVVLIHDLRFITAGRVARYTHMRAVHRGSECYQIINVY